jgi:hypothetical protein
VSDVRLDDTLDSLGLREIPSTFKIEVDCSIVDFAFPGKSVDDSERRQKTDNSKYCGLQIYSSEVRSALSDRSGYENHCIDGAMCFGLNFGVEWKCCNPEVPCHGDSEI